MMTILLLVIMLLDTYGDDRGGGRGEIGGQDHHVIIINLMW